jgi:hypothetical protein
LAEALTLELELDVSTLRTGSLIDTQLLDFAHSHSIVPGGLLVMS